MRTLRLVIISDIHFGHFSVHSDFCAEKIKSSNILKGSVSMIDSLIERLNEYEFIDEILITGDLTSYATPYEYSELFKRIEKIKHSIKKFNGQVIFTLGNHDSNWDVSSIALDNKYNDFDSEYFLGKSANLHSDFNFVNTFTVAGPVPCSGIISTEKANIIVLNSGLYSSKDQKYKHGKIGAEQLLTRQP